MPAKFPKQSPNTDPEPSPDTKSHLLPYRQSYPAASGQVNFKYTGCLKMRTPIFTAIQDDGKEIVIKFVDWYNVSTLPPCQLQPYSQAILCRRVADSAPNW